MPWMVSSKAPAGLDDEVVQAWLGSVDRDADHDVGETDGRVPAGEGRVGEAAAVRQQVDRELGRDLLAVLKQADERVGVQGRLAAGEAEGTRARGQQADDLPGPVEQPGSSRSLGGWEHIRQ